jgi:hypothetical protein
VIGEIEGPYSTEITMQTQNSPTKEGQERGVPATAIEGLCKTEIPPTTQKEQPHEHSEEKIPPTPSKGTDQPRWHQGTRSLGHIRDHHHRTRSSKNMPSRSWSQKAQSYPKLTSTQEQGVAKQHLQEGKTTPTGAVVAKLSLGITALAEEAFR